MTDIIIHDFTNKQRCSTEMYYTVEALLKQAPHFAGFNNLNEKISWISLFMGGDRSCDHWEIFLYTSTNIAIKVDLIECGYRILYGTALPSARATKNNKFEWIALETPHTFRDVFKSTLQLAIRRGPWKRACLFKNTCQYFSIMFMKHFDLPDQQIFKYELKYTVNKAMPPLITEYNDIKLRNGKYQLEHNY
ncbi:MAG: hypothetical protein KAH18_11745 [Psychromonas sp.]|nr:hypothetical protein [Psychromonas sp.]